MSLCLSGHVSRWHQRAKGAGVSPPKAPPLRVEYRDIRSRGPLLRACAHLMHNSFHIPWAKPYLGDEEIAAVLDTLSERRLSMGATVKGFEEDAAALVQREHAIA